MDDGTAPAPTPTSESVGRLVRGAYSSADRSTRLHVRVRRHLAPFAAMERLIPGHGRLLDFGCGHGVLSLFLAANALDRTIHAVDIDAGRIRRAAAAATAAGLDDRIQVELIDPAWRPARAAYDIVVASDVLYLLAPEGVRRTTDALLAALRPGGVLLVKEVGATPRWKHRVALAQEWLAVRALGITQGDAINPAPLADVVATAVRAGWETEEVRIDAGYFHPHVAHLVSRTR